jgi:hypothetical protein
MNQPQRGPRRALSLKSGQYERGLADYLDQPVYDTVVLKNSLGAYQFRLFQVPKGGTGPSGEIKDLSMTNIKIGGQVPQTQNWRIHAVRVGYFAHAAYATAIPIITVINTSVLELVVDGKDLMYQKPLADTFGLCLGIELAATLQPVELFENRLVGVDKLNKPITLPAGCVYEWDCTLLAASPASLDTDRIRVSMATEFLRANA